MNKQYVPKLPLSTKCIIQLCAVALSLQKNIVFIKVKKAV